MTLRKLVSGLIAGWAGSIVFGFVFGIFSYFILSPLGALAGLILGFRWGYKRIDEEPATSGIKAVWVDSEKTSHWPTTLGDTAFLITGFFAAVWIAVAVPNLFFGFSGPYRGHWLGLMLPLCGVMLSPIGGIVAQQQARKHIDTTKRDSIGVATLVGFVLLVSLWWQWAEAHDRATSERTRGIGAPIWNQS